METGCTGLQSYFPSALGCWVSKVDNGDGMAFTNVGTFCQSTDVGTKNLRKLINFQK